MHEHFHSKVSKALLGAARVHKGSGWAIYDNKFCQKASHNRTLVSSDIDNQLCPTDLQDLQWHPLYLRRSTRFLLSQTVSRLGANSGVLSIMLSTALVSVKGNHVTTDTSATGEIGPT